MKKQRWVISSDWHLPYHDPRLVNLVLDVAEDIGCTHFLINGDFLDFYNINMHGPKSPRVIESLEEEFSSGLEWIDKIRNRLPNQKIHLSLGNHEHRLERFILKNCKAFYNILSVDKMLQLKRYNVTWSRYQEKIQIPNIPVYIMHSPPSYSKHSASVSLDKKVEGNWIFSCTHRPTWALKPTDLGNIYEAFTMGWLGSTTLTESHREVFSFAKGHESWAHSFIIVDVVGDSFFINHHIIRDYKVSVGGFVYEG